MSIRTPLPRSEFIVFMHTAIMRGSLQCYSVREPCKRKCKARQHRGCAATHSYTASPNTDSSPYKRRVHTTNTLQILIRTSLCSTPPLLPGPPPHGPWTF